MKKYLILFALGLAITLGSCEKEPMEETPMEEEPTETSCDTESINYNDDIMSLFSGCSGSSCHGSGTGREMTDYLTTKDYAEGGRLLGALNHDSGFSAMPKNGTKFTDCNISKVKAWIDAGFPES